MSNLDKKKQWEKWYPEEVLLNDSKKNNFLFWNSNILKETDFYVKKNPQENNKFVTVSKKSDKIEDPIFSDQLLNLKKNLQEKEKEFTILNHKLERLCLNFENTITIFEKMLFSRLLKTILIISSYIIGEKISIKKTVLLNKINKIIENKNFFLKKPKLIVHPINQKIIEKLLKKSNKKWELVFDQNIDINSFKIQSENGDIDATIFSRWREVSNIIFQEEKDQ
ncbi:Flagellar assembly protein FliH [Buchnera aphidicola (Protaphis terricola)]|uniref:FliH/SctL family protein n=1 Tax=Buchnera aphidicola TaxID=9 RepID=UPI003463D6B6